MRIRTVKPEWMEDEQLLRAGSDARVLSVCLILMADDYGRGRFIPEVLAPQCFPFEESSRVFRESLARLSDMGFVRVYAVRGQRYFEIRNWAKHQKVDKPGKPHVPEPLEPDPGPSREPRETLAPDLWIYGSKDLGSTEPTPNACAREEQTLSQPIALIPPVRARDFGGDDSDDRAAIRGRVWIRDTTTRDYDHGGTWRHALIQLARKPAPELERAATVLTVEREKPGVISMLTPRHVLDHWHRYGLGEAPGKRSEVDSRTPLEAAEERMRAAKSAHSEAERRGVPAAELKRLFDAWGAASADVKRLKSQPLAAAGGL